MLLIICAVILNSVEKKTGRQSAKFILLCIVVFLLNGATSVVSKIHQIETRYAIVSADSFVVLKNIVRFVFFTIILPFFGQKREEPRKKLTGKIYFIMLMSAIVNGVAYMLQLIGAASLPATVLFPIVTGGTIVCTSLFDKICFKEKLSRKTKISIAICVLALILFVIE